MGFERGLKSWNQDESGFWKSNNLDKVSGLLSLFALILAEKPENREDGRGEEPRYLPKEISRWFIIFLEIFYLAKRNFKMIFKILEIFCLASQSSFSTDFWIRKQHIWHTHHVSDMTLLEQLKIVRKILESLENIWAHCYQGEFWTPWGEYKMQLEIVNKVNLSWKNTYVDNWFCNNYHWTEFGGRTNFETVHWRETLLSRRTCKVGDPAIRTWS